MVILPMSRSRFAWTESHFTLSMKSFRLDWESTLICLWMPILEWGIYIYTHLSPLVKQLNSQSRQNDSRRTRNRAKWPASVSSNQVSYQHSYHTFLLLFSQFPWPCVTRMFLLFLHSGHDNLMPSYFLFPSDPKSYFLPYIVFQISCLRDNYG